MNRDPPGRARRGSAHQLKAPIATIGTCVLFPHLSSIHDGARGATRPTIAVVLGANRDYVKHDKPKKLFVRELCRNARRSLQAEHLKADLARVEAKVPVRCSLPVKEIESIAQQFR